MQFSPTNGDFTFVSSADAEGNVSLKALKIVRHFSIVIAVYPVCPEVKGELHPPFLTSFRFSLPPLAQADFDS